MRTERSKDAHPSLIMVEMTDEHPSLLVGGLEARPLSRPRSPVSPRVSAPLLRECGTLDTIRGYGDTRTIPQTNHIVSTSRDMCITPPDGTTAHHITYVAHAQRIRQGMCVHGQPSSSCLHHTVVPSATGRVDADAASHVGLPASGQVCWHARPPGASR